MSSNYYKLYDIELDQIYDKSKDIFQKLDQNKITGDAIYVTIKPSKISEFGNPNNFNSNIIQLALKKLGRYTFAKSELPYLFEAS